MRATTPFVSNLYSQLQKHRFPGNTRGLERILWLALTNRTMQRDKLKPTNGKYVIELDIGDLPREVSVEEAFDAPQTDHAPPTPQKLKPALIALEQAVNSNEGADWVTTAQVKARLPRGTSLGVRTLRNHLMELVDLGRAYKHGTTSDLEWSIPRASQTRTGRPRRS